MWKSNKLNMVIDICRYLSVALFKDFNNRELQNIEWQIEVTFTFTCSG